VKGFGRQKGHTEAYRGSEYTVDSSRSEAEIAVGDALLGRTVETILKPPRREKSAMARCLLCHSTRVIRIRTEEQGDAAI